jgi:hypothetical protein
VLCHEHVAIMHRGNASAQRAAEYLSEGLHRGQRCCCVAPVTSRRAMLVGLRDRGVNVDWHLHEGTLLFPPAAQEPADLVDCAIRFFADAEAAHAPAVRWFEEGLWGKPAGMPVPEFFALHSRLNYLVKEYPSVAVCQYNTEHMEIPDLFSAISVHRHLMVDGTLVRDNPFYIPTEKFLAMSAADRERDLRAAFREVGFDWDKLCATLAGYGQLQRPAPPEP